MNHKKFLSETFPEVIKKHEQIITDRTIKTRELGLSLASSVFSQRQFMGKTEKPISQRAA